MTSGVPGDTFRFSDINELFCFTPTLKIGFGAFPSTSVDISRSLFVVIVDDEFARKLK
jgi:hypothetical protein